ncbi:MAG: glycosyltransferase family 9 protein [Methylacidiphilales bacterium]|nr:glycosyltransferase family 9 protein [Candidatus Methylacidiphilales bacterium]
MRVLLIKPKHIGDSLILTPTITAIKRDYPDAEIWVVVRRGGESILAGCPEIHRIFTLTGIDKDSRKRGDFWRQVGVLLKLRSVTFDYIFELGDGHRARLFAMLCRGRKRYSVKTASPLNWLERRRFTAMSGFDWETCHRVEKDFHSVSKFLSLAQPIPPLRFDPPFMKAWKPAEKLDDFCVVQVGSRQAFNRWHREGWREVCRALLKRFSRVVIACGPVAHEIEEAAWVRRELGSSLLNTEGKTTWPEMAWLFSRAKLYVGPNTAAMHLAAACGCPVVALFGPSIEDYWYPWQVPYRIVTSHGYIPVTDTRERYAQVKKRSMAEIEARDVIAACEELLAEKR